MKLATIANDTRDGALAVISRDGERYLQAADTAPTLQDALDSWAATEPKLRAAAATSGTGRRLAHRRHTFSRTPAPCLAVAGWLRVQEPWRPDGKGLRYRPGSNG